MAADVGHRFSGWTYSDVPYINDHSREDPSVQQMVQDHGSVSFGRFAAEPLSWERRSVFAHNSRQEELSKLTAPGLVAQKRAFFEEYYKSRQLKARGAMHQTQATSEQVNDENTLGRSSLEEQLPAAVSDDPVTSGPSSSFEPSTEVSSSDERKCQEAHDIGYLTFNPLFSQTAGLQNIQQEERSSSHEKQYLDRELPCATNTTSNYGHIREALGRKFLAPRRVVSNDNDENNVAKMRIAIASLQSQGLKVAHGKQGARKSVAPIDKPVKKPKDLPTSAIHIPRMDFRRNSENRPSQDLKDPFHKRVEMKLRALSDRMSAEKSATSSRPASYQPPNRAMSTCKSSYQNADKLANSSRPSLFQNTGRVLAPSKSSAQASQRSHLDARLHASLNNTATGRSAAKTLVVPSSSQVGRKTSRSAQVTSKGASGLTRVNNAPQNKRKQLSTPATSDENNPKRVYVRKTMTRSARSSSDSHPPAKGAKIANRTNKTKSDFVQKSRSATANHPVGGRNNMTEITANCNEQNRKVTSTRAGSLAGSSVRSNPTGAPSRTKSKPRQEKPRWR